MIGSYELLAGWLRARFGSDDRGSSVIEYALLVALLALTCITVITTLRDGIRTTLDDSGSALSGG